MWGRPPGLLPTPPSAYSQLDETDRLDKERVRGDPRGPGGPPHNLRTPQSREAYPTAESQFGYAPL